MLELIETNLVETPLNSSLTVVKFHPSQAQSSILLETSLIVVKFQPSSVDQVCPLTEHATEQEQSLSCSVSGRANCCKLCKRQAHCTSRCTLQKRRENQQPSWQPSSFSRKIFLEKENKSESEIWWPTSGNTTQNYRNTTQSIHYWRNARVIHQSIRRVPIPFRATTGHLL